MIQTRNLTKRHGARTVVDGLDLEVRPGVVTGFLGPNGAGKSTTMRMILGLEDPSQGEATIDGVAYRSLDNPLRTVGSMLDASWIHPARSGRNHLRWLAASNGIARRRVDEVLELVGLGQDAHRPAGHYSLGMRQRLGLAAAMLGRPRHYILDEPVNGLDPEGIVWIRRIMRQLASEGSSVMVSSHLLGEMALTADHLVVIARGRLVADTSMADFIAEHSTTTTTVRARNLDGLAEVLRRHHGVVEKVLAHSASTAGDTQDHLVVRGLSTRQIGEAAAAAGIVVHEISEQRASLEDAFMAMTGQPSLDQSPNPCLDELVAVA